MNQYFFHSKDYTSRKKQQFVESASNTYNSLSRQKKLGDQVLDKIADESQSHMPQVGKIPSKKRRRATADMKLISKDYTS